MNPFYIGEESYFGLSRRRPLIPEGEVWVFQQVDGECSIVWGADNTVLPPAAPLFASSAMTIYKFQRKIELQGFLRLFADPGLPITIDVNVTLFLRDPIQFIASVQSPDTSQSFDTNKLKNMDFEELRPTLEDALQRALKEEGFVRNVPSLMASDYEIAIPLSFSQLLPQTDLSSYIQKLPELKKRGLEARMIVLTASILGSYTTFVQDTMFAAQKHLLPLQQEMDIIATGIEREKLQKGLRFDFAEQGAMLEKELYQSHLEQIEHLRPALYPIIEHIVQRNEMMKEQTVPSVLVIAIFNDVIYQTIKQVLQHITSSQSSPLSSLNQTFDDERAGQIQALYLTTQAKGWKILPLLQEKVKEEISFDLGNDSRFLLIVPSTYPDEKIKPVITNVKKQGNRLSRSEINKITGPVLQNNSYNLNILVEAIANELLKNQGSS